MNTETLNIETASRLSRGYFICLTATALWSSTGIFIRYLTETYQMPPLLLAFWRDLILVVALILVLLQIKPAVLRLERRHVIFFALFGFEISLFNSLWTVSVALNGAAVATVLAYSSAAFTAILGWRLFSERLGPHKILAVIFSLAGCVFVSGAFNPSVWQVNPLGVLTGVLSGLAFAGYSLMGKSASRRGVNPWTTLLYSFTFAVPLILLYNLTYAWLPPGLGTPNLLWLGGSLAGWGILIFLAVGPTIGGFGLYTVSLTTLPASVANLIATLEPVMTAGLAFILLGERFSATQWVGGALIISGVVMLRLSERPAAVVPSPEGLLPVPLRPSLKRDIRYQGAVVRDHHILLLRNCEHASGREYWLIPGGGIQDGETPQECLVRELGEETHLQVSVERLLFKEAWESDETYQGAETYLCAPLSGVARPGSEPEVDDYSIVDLSWFDLREEMTWDGDLLADPVTYPQVKRIQDVLGYGSPR